LRFYCELFFLISFGVFGQDIPEIVNDSIPLVNNDEVIIDSLERISEPLSEKEIKIDGLEQQTVQEKDSLAVTLDSLTSKSKEKKRKRKKRKAPEVKPMSSVTISDYKYSYMNDVWKSVDTALTIYNDYDFNFLRRDNFELLSFPNMGETYNRLGYDFQSQPLGPQIGARGKHFGYFEKEDIPYYNVPSPFSDLFFKSTFDQGQHLDSQLAINTSPRFNIYIGYRGFRSLGHYASSRSAATQFRMSTHYETYNKRYRLRMHQASQKLQNRVNGGLNNDSVYYFENAPNYADVDEKGEIKLDENGDTIFINYDGFLDRNRLGTNIRGENILSGKRYFVEQRYQMLSKADDSLKYQLQVGHYLNFEKKEYGFTMERISNYFTEAFTNDAIDDGTSLNTIENNFFAAYENNSVGKLNLNLQHFLWEYSVAPNNYEPTIDLAPGIDASQWMVTARWQKEIRGFQLNAKIRQSLKDRFADNSYEVGIKQNIGNYFSFEGNYQYRSMPLNFNFLLYQSDYKIYNWYDDGIQENQKFSTLSAVIGHSKWGQIQGQWTQLEKYAYFKNITLLRRLNTEFLNEPAQAIYPIDYYKLGFYQHLDFGKWSLINTVQYQKVYQQEDEDSILGVEPIILNVPEWNIRSTVMLSSFVFKKALYLQTGVTFKFFTDFYADQYNPLLAEFITQNNLKIGEYPVIDFFANAKVQTTRIFLKIENINERIEHMINEDAPYDYYVAPFTPYRDFSIRIGLIWNFFE
tara:strand:- start:175 stop:2415 length:2241 start_codon:yes stop_codon:yes gene_type:complete